MPKTELVQKFHVLYLGMISVSRPIGKSKYSYTHCLMNAVAHCLTVPTALFPVLRYGHH